MSEPSATPQLPSSTPRSLLEQMQELLASVTADLAELQSSGPRATAGYPTGTDTSEAPAAPGTR
ncbi:hypothetical protein ACPC54_37640 [Kitasatospora sp. NPDC094028]